MSIKIPATLLALIVALSAVPAQAQTPARFPAVPAETISDMTRNARCAETVTTVARTVAQIEGWRGYAMVLCDPDGQRAGPFVAWRSNSDGSLFVPARPDGVPFPTSDEGFINDGNQQAQWTAFGVRFDSGPAVCAFARLNRIREPFVASFCIRR